MKEKQKGILIHIGVGAIITALSMTTSWNKGYSVPHLLCDGFFVAAVLLLGLGGLKFARNKGNFDIMAYGVRSAFQLHFPFTKMNSPLEEKNEDFVAYKERKRAERKSSAEALYAGAVFLVLAVVMFAVYLLMDGT